ncbi:MAG: Gfo/Idh/MocA family oxidoreductase [Pelomonas sp.]|nr:Gfo/Idh/MocA family oxidoreductase [Roseateles sp.]
MKKILIVGLGYAGRRYLRTFRHLADKLGLEIEMAYVGRRRRDEAIAHYLSVPQALLEFGPDLVVVSCNDHGHVGVLEDLAGFDGFVLCEKPLATPGDGWARACVGLAHCRGFALNLIERYSDVTQHLRDLVARCDGTLVRASFHWGKNRLNDYRPTCGVTSEVIHALDLVEWVGAPGTDLQLQQAIGVGSDFSISRDATPDTVLLTASLGGAVVAGYGSFVNVERQRTLDFTFVDPSGRIFHARGVYDTPAWDHDTLRVWTRDAAGRDVVIDELSVAPSGPGLETLHKLSRLCEDVLCASVPGGAPRQPFAGLDDAMRLQRLLDAISRCLAATPLFARYVRGAPRVLVPESADLERLG